MWLYLSWATGHWATWFATLPTLKNKKYYFYYFSKYYFFYFYPI